MTSANRVLVTGGTGKTGRRIIERLKALGVFVRVGSRAAEPRFDWTQPETWPAALEGVDAVYIAYQPDLAVPGAVETIRAFTALAVKSGIKHLVLLSGRGEAEAQACEEIVQNAGVNWTILRASWFFQNFSENFLVGSILSGAVYLPVGDVKEPFIDADDIADVAIAALTEAGHANQLYEITGPELLTFAEATAQIAEAAGREITYTQISQEDFNAAVESAGVTSGELWLMNYLFTTVFDGRNAVLADGVAHALGRNPRKLSDYARETAASGVWNA